MSDNLARVIRFASRIWRRLTSIRICTEGITSSAVCGVSVNLVHEYFTTLGFSYVKNINEN
jgi:hypothetical protein